MQSFLTTISELIKEKDLPVLVIGGHAVTALGHPRATFDLDLLIPPIVRRPVESRASQTALPDLRRVREFPSV